MPRVHSQVAILPQRFPGCLVFRRGTSAPGLSDGGDLYVRLAQVHIQREKWQEAADALRQAIEKGGLEKLGDAQLLMGIVYYSQQRPESARTWFARARKHEATREEADTWLRHIGRELRSG